MAKFPLHSDSFFTENSVKAPDVNFVVDKYKKNVVEHIEAHLKLMLKSEGVRDINFQKIVDVTVDGEYKLVLDGDNAVLQYNDNQIVGAYNTGGSLSLPEGLPLTKQGDEWFANEITSVGSGAKFMLPSLGTEVVKLHATGNSTDVIKNSFISEVKSFCAFFFNSNGDYDDSNLPERYNQPIADVHFAIGDALSDIRPAPSRLTDLCPIPLIVLQEILAADDLDVDLLNSNSIMNAIENQYSDGFYSNSEDSTMDMVSAIFSKIFPRDSTRVTALIGREVIVPDNRSTSRIYAYFGDEAEQPDNIFRLLSQETSPAGEETFSLELVDLSNNAQLGTYPDLNEMDAGNHQKINADHFSFIPSYEKDGTGDATKGKGIPIQPKEVVSQRALLDAFFKMQVYTHLHQQYDTNFNDRGNYNEKHISLRYISDMSNSSNRKADILSRYTRLLHPRAGSLIAAGLLTPHQLPDRNQFYGKKDKSPKQLVSVLSSLRAYYTLSILSIIRSKSMDKEIMDRVYTNSLLRQEVNWLIGALSDSGKALVKKDVPNDLLTVLEYQSIGSGNVNELGFAPKKTAFYEVESPLVKDIFTLYSEVYNEFTIMNAYGIKDRKKVKEVELARSIWTNLEKRNKNVFDQEEIVPHVFFRVLFSKISTKASASSIIASIYPDTWSGTNYVTSLQADPLETGISYEREFYQARLNEFVSHLSRSYKTNHRIPTILISTIESAKIANTKDIDSLKRQFEERLDRDAKMKKLASTGTTFRAYEVMITILRAYINVPTDKMNEFVAAKVDNALREKIRDNLISRSSSPSIPEGHPEASTQP